MLDGMTNPHRTLLTTASRDDDPDLIQGNSAVTQEQQVVHEVLQLVVIKASNAHIIFNHEVFVVDVDKWNRAPEIAPPW